MYEWVDGWWQFIDDSYCDICHKSGEGLMTVVWNHGIVYSCEECYGLL